MRFLFKTTYDQDLRLFRHGGQVFWYGLLAVVLLAAPWWASEYLLSQLHFIGIYSIVGLGLMLLVGFTGQISLGHAGHYFSRSSYYGKRSFQPMSCCRHRSKICKRWLADLICN